MPHISIVNPIENDMARFWVTNCHNKGEPRW